MCGLTFSGPRSGAGSVSGGAVDSHFAELGAALHALVGHVGDFACRELAEVAVAVLISRGLRSGRRQLSGDALVEHHVRSIGGIVFAVGGIFAKADAATLTASLRHGVKTGSGRMKGKTSGERDGMKREPYVYCSTAVFMSHRIGKAQ